MIPKKKKTSSIAKGTLNTRGFEDVQAKPNPPTETPGHQGAIPYGSGGSHFPPRKKNMGKNMDEGQYGGKHIVPP